MHYLKMMRAYFKAAFLSGFLLLFANAGLADKPTLVYGAQWLPQAQFAGYYVAYDQGFYDEAGINVEIIHPTVTVNTIEYLLTGRADVVSLFLITAINNRFEGIELVNIGQLSQHSAIMFVSKKDSGIETLEDFDNKRIGVWLSGFQEVPYSLMADRQVQVEWVPILSSVNLFLMGGLDGMTVMWYNEYKQIYLSGVNHEELNMFFMADYDYDIPEDGLYVLPQTLETKEKELQAFLEATLRGWDYAAKNREYTIELVVRLMREAHIPASYAHQRWMLDRILELQAREGSASQRFHLDKEDYQKAISIMERFSAIRSPFTYEEFFRPVLEP
ncbi:MAG: ABC transporter substrate-binding protein [Bacteroidales bacterium]|nr:ABC transporter substrate-binding protein [Bacteroidales bacterium]